MGNCLSAKNSGQPKFIMSKAKSAEMKKLYDIDTKKLLGEGSFGRVFKAKNKSDSTI